VLADGQGRAEPDGPRPGRQQQDLLPLAQDGKEQVALGGARQVEGAHQPAAAHVRDQAGEPGGKLVELGEEPGADRRAPVEKQATSCGRSRNAASAWRSARCSAASVSARCPASGNLTAGTSTRGQPNTGKRSVFTGSVLVSESVYPLRPWNARVRCSTCVPSRGERPRASLCRLFQSKAHFSAF